MIVGKIASRIRFSNIHRCFSNNGPFTAKSNSFYDYQQPQRIARKPQQSFEEDNESNVEDFVEERPRFPQKLSPSPSAEAPKSAIKSELIPQNPFPEELQQAYSTGTDLISRSGEYSFTERVVQVLTQPIEETDVEIKPDGIIYLPEVRYRKILLRAFGPGGWCLVPKGPHTLTGPTLSREYALYCEGRFISQARGSASISSFNNPALASESVRSNALMRCCKDLGIADELWDPLFVARWKKQYAIKRTFNDPSGRSKVIWSKRETAIEE